MMKSLFIITISFFLLLNCHFKRQNNSKEKPSAKNDQAQPAVSQPTTPQAEESVKFTLPSCSEDNCCSKNTDCIKQCDRLFPEMETKQKCLGFPIKLVADMNQTINEYLKSPDWEILKKIDPFALWSVIRVSEKPWLNRIKSYSKPLAEVTLFWLASNPDISESVFTQFPRQESIRILLIALFRQNTRSSLMDDNALLSSFKEDLSDKEDSYFFKVVEQNNNRSLLSIVHKEIIAGHICEYSINRPIPTDVSDKTYEACVLSAYCYFTGSYMAGQYVSTQKDDRGQGQKLRRWLAGEINSERVNNFIQALQVEGGLEVLEGSADHWSDLACQKLTDLWDDGNIHFGL